MVCFRIASCNYADDLTGTGARLYGGRWNSVGKPMVYLAASRSLAMLEVLVHLAPSILPENFCVAEIEVPDDDMIVLDIKSLPPNWYDMSGPSLLKKMGDDFIAQKKHLVMKVPSAIVREEYNFLLNPFHPRLSSVKIIGKEDFNFDPRLKR